MVIRWRDFVMEIRKKIWESIFYLMLRGSAEQPAATILPEKKVFVDTCSYQSERREVMKANKAQIK